MTTRYTDQEWAAIIAATENVALQAISKIPKAVPAVDSPSFAQTIDHTLLKLDATKAQIDSLCSEARVAGFASVCVRPNFAERAAANVRGSIVKVAVVVGFHTGENDLSEKVMEAGYAASHGAKELDVVVNRTDLLAGRYETVYKELAAIRSIAPHPVLLKLILETSQLSDKEIIAGAVIARAAQFDFIKTSTGFLGHGATVEHVRLMSACCEVLGEPAQGGWAGNGLLDEYRSLVNSAGLAVEEPVTPMEDGNPSGPATRTIVQKMQVKASGGVRTLQDAIAMLEAGATRLGTSAGVWIMKEAGETAKTGSMNAGVEGGAGSDYVSRAFNRSRPIRQAGHSRTDSTGSNARPRDDYDLHSPTWHALTDRSTRRRSSSQTDRAKESPAVDQGAGIDAIRNLHSATNARQRQLHQPNHTTRLPLYPVEEDAASHRKGHTRRAHGGSDSILSSRTLHNDRTLNPTRPLAYDPNEQSFVPSRITPALRDAPVGQPQTRSHPASSRHNQARPDSTPQFRTPTYTQTLPTRTSSLHTPRRRGVSLSIPPTSNTSTTSSPASSKSRVDSADPTRPPSFSLFPSISTPKRSSPVTSTALPHAYPIDPSRRGSPARKGESWLDGPNTHERKFSLPTAYPGGERVEMVVVEDDARGMWEGNGVVLNLHSPGLPIHGGTRGSVGVGGKERKDSAAEAGRKGRSLGGGRPGITRLYTDL